MLGITLSGAPTSDAQVAVLRALPAADLPAEAARLERLAGEQDRHGLQLSSLSLIHI